MNKTTEAQNPKITVLVCIKQSYTRDQQYYTGENPENCWDDDENDNWGDVQGSVVVATKCSSSIEEAIKEVANVYGRPVGIFEGYQIVGDVCDLD